MHKNCLLLILTAGMLTLLLTACGASGLQAASAASGTDAQSTSFGTAEETRAAADEASASDAQENGANAEADVGNGTGSTSGNPETSSCQDGDSNARAVSEADTEAEADAGDDTAAGADSQTAAKSFTYGGVTTLSPSEEALAQRQTLQEHPRNFVWKKVFFKITMWILRGNYNQDFPDQWTVCNKEHLTYGSNDVYTLGSDDADCIILYIHGGGYVYGVNSDSTMDDQITVCDKLAVNLHAQVYIPLYTLAPRGKWHDAYQLFDQLYEDLEATGKPIYLLGDSAGGGTALAYAMWRRDRGEALPEKLILISPWLDLTLSNPKIAACERTDNILAPYALQQFGKFWADQLDPADPLVSPVYGDLSGLPPTLVFTGTEEIMYPDIAALYEKMTEAGSSISLVCGDRLWHNFVGASIPESDQCIGMMLEFCRMN